MSQKKYVSLSKLSTFLDNLKNLFATKTSLDELSIDVAYINSVDNENITDVDEEQSSSIKENIGVEILNKKINNLENAVSPLLVVDKVDDTTALFKQVPAGVLPYAYLNKLGDNCNAYHFGANILDFKKTFPVIHENEVDVIDFDFGQARVLSDGRLEFPFTDAFTDRNTSREMFAVSIGLNADTFIYPPSTYSAKKEYFISDKYSMSSDISAKITTCFTARTLMSNSEIRIEEDTEIAEPFFIEKFVVNLDYFSNFTVPENFEMIDFIQILDTNLSFGSKSLDFTPYVEPTLLFNTPSEIFTLDGYGSTGNYIDFDRKVYVRTSHGDEIDVSKYLLEDNMIGVEAGGIILFQPMHWSKAGLNLAVINELMAWASNPYTSMITFKKEIFFNGITTVGTSWDDVKDVIRSGFGKFIFPTGYEFTMKDQITGNDLVWVVRGHDNHKASDSRLKHTMTLELKDVYSAESGLYQPIQFDGTEALYYVEEGLSAGTYHFTVVDHLHENDNGKTFQFTLEKDVPAGSKLILSLPYAEASLSNQSLLVECNGELCTNASEGWAHGFEHEIVKLLIGQNGGTNLGTTGQGNFNHIQRTVGGSNNYAQSAIRQWLNGKGTDFWKPQTRFDLAPTWDGSVSGLISSLPEEFLNLVQEAEIPCYTNSIYETNSLDGTEYGLEMNYTVKDKFFILSTPEVYSGYREENLKDYMYDGDALDFYDGIPHSERIKYDLAGRPRDVRERSTTIQTVTHTKFITKETGNGSGTTASHTRIGVTPACIIA